MNDEQRQQSAAEPHAESEAHTASTPDAGDQGTPPPPGGTPHTGQPQTQSEPEPPSGGWRFFEWLRTLGLVRDDERWIGGVCGAIATRTGLDPIIIRGIAVVLFFFGGFGVFAYALLWLLLPNAEGAIHAENVLRGHGSGWAWAAVIVVAFMAFSWLGGWDPQRRYWWPGGWIGPVIWSFVIIAAVIWLIVWLARRSGSNGNNGASAASGPSTVSTSAQPHDDATRPQHIAPSAAPGSGPQAAAAAAAADARARNAAARRAQAQQQRERLQAQRAAARERRRRERPSAAVVSIMIGAAILAAVVAGCAASLTLKGATAVMLGIATALAVLGIAITVLGLLGRRGGALSGFAVLTALALMIASPAAWLEGRSLSRPTWTVAASSLSDPVSGYGASFDAFGAASELDLREAWSPDFPERDWFGFFGPTVRVDAVASTLAVRLPTTGTFRINVDGAFSNLDVSGQLGTSSMRSSATTMFESRYLYVRDGRLVANLADDAGPSSAGTQPPNGTIDVRIDAVASTVHIIAADDPDPDAAAADAVSSRAAPRSPDATDSHSSVVSALLPSIAGVDR